MIRTLASTITSLLVCLASHTFVGDAFGDAPQEISVVWGAMQVESRPLAIIVSMKAGSRGIQFVTDSSAMQPLGPFENQIDSIPVWTEAADGNYLRGVHLPLTSGLYVLPTQAQELADGRWLIHTTTNYRSVTRHRGARESELETREQRVQTPLFCKMDGSESIPIIKVSPVPTQGASRGGWTLDFVPVLDTFPDEHEQSILASLARVELKFENLIPSNGGFVDIQTGFAMLPDPFRQITDVRGGSQNWPIIRNALVGFVAADGESSQELNVVSNVPPGNTIPAVFTTGPMGDIVTQVPLVNISSAQAKKWGFPPIPGLQFDAILTIDSDTAWDFNPKDGLDPGALDFERVVVHEVIHALGFNSVLDIAVLDPNFPGNVITLWDVFRVDQAAAPGGVLPTTFRNANRMLLPGREVFGVGGFFNAAFRWAMSTGSVQNGDGFVADHWKSAPLINPADPDSVWIGVMEPEYPRAIPGYVTAADLGALDIIGWNMVDPIFVGPPPAPGFPQPQAPLNGAVGQPLQPTFQWVSGGNTSTFDVYVFEGPVVQSTMRVLAADGLIGTEFTPSVIVLHEGRRYTWIVTGTNVHGHAVSQSFQFVTEVESCDGDVDCSGSVDVNDISFVVFRLGNVGLSCPDKLTPGDADGSGGVDVNDVSYVIFRLNTCAQAPCGCPDD